MILRAGGTEGELISVLLSDGHLILSSCPLHSQARNIPTGNTKPCLPPRMSQTSKLATHQQMIVEEDWEAALTITAQRGLSPFLCLHSAYMVHMSLAALPQGVGGAGSVEVHLGF